VEEPLTDAELREFAKLFPPDATTRSLMRRAGFDLTEIPVTVAGQRPDDYWDLINALIADGSIRDGRRRLLEMARRRYAYNSVLFGQQIPRVRRILLLGASPAVAQTAATLDPLRSDREYRAILDAAQGMTVEYRPFATPADIQRTLEYEPDILHLACHGTGPMLMFHDRVAERPDPRNARAVHAADLAAVLLAYKHEGGRQLLGIVLNACSSVEAGMELRSCAATIVAHRGDLPDEAAANVARELYGKIALSGSLASAARLVKAELPVLDDRGRPIATGMVILDGAS